MPNHQKNQGNKDKIQNPKAPRMLLKTKTDLKIPVNKDRGLLNPVQNLVPQKEPRKQMINKYLRTEKSA